MSAAPLRQDDLEALIEPVCAAHGVELVLLRQLSQGRRNVLQIIIDRAQETAGGPDGSGVTLDDCTNVSRDLSTVLDMHEDLVPGHYNLEVSSPGLDRPLTKLSHFERFVGREAKVEIKTPIDGRRRFDGPILGVEAEIVTLEQDKKPVRIPFRDVVKAHLVYRF